MKIKIKDKINVTDRKIGFIGLGRIGSGMATNLLKAGIPLIIYDLDQGSMNELAKKGAQIAKSPAEISAEVDLVFLHNQNLIHYSHQHTSQL